MVLMSKKKDGMRSMMGRLEGYLYKKGLNAEKTKIMRFRKEGGKIEKRN